MCRSRRRTRIKREARQSSIPHSYSYPPSFPPFPKIAAGVIHSDFEKGFIRAETMSFEDLVALGSEKAVKDAGKLRSEGKDYVCKEGDVMLFRFNV